jgi:hypothetical protein
MAPGELSSRWIDARKTSGNDSAIVLQSTSKACPSQQVETRNLQLAF